MRSLFSRLFTFRFWRRLVVVVVVLIAVTASGLWLADKIWPLPAPDVQVAKVVVAEDGSPLWRFADADGVWRYSVSLNEVSPYYLQALLTYEDRWFYSHPGINPLAIMRALWQNLANQRIVSGGSTLSMQVARLIEPHDKTFFGKLRQVFRTLQLEWHYTKDQILTIYINRAPYGGTLQGIGAASWAYLDKPPSELTRSEAALLAVLPQAPSRLRPDRYPERAQAARDKVLDRLEEYGVWDKAQVDDIKQESVWLAERQAPQLAPLLSRRLLAESSTDVIHTTIDASLQRRLEDMVMGWKSQLPPSTSMGILVVDHSTMSVKAYIGSADLNDRSRFGHVDMISAWRSPGSTLKPFAYAMALDDGLIHAESLLQDVPRQFGDYRPGNFDTGFSGPVSASDALVRSLNLPAVQVLEAYGPKRFTGNMRNAGIVLRFPLNSDPNLSLILGGTGMRMDQLVSGYSAFVRQGKVAALRYRPEDPLVERQLVSPGAAWIVRRIMAGEGRPVPDSQISDITPLAWKTGTSYGYRDAWTIGMNGGYLIGIWVGRPDGTPVAGQFGYATAVPILHQINHLLINRNNQLAKNWPKDPRPYSVSRAVICWPQGQTLEAGDTNCRQRRQAWILDGTIPPTLSSIGQDTGIGGWLNLWVNAEGKRVAADCSGAISRRIALWPIALETWLPSSERRISRLPERDTECPPISYDVSPPLLILGLKDGAILKRIPGTQSLDLRLDTQGGRGKRWWFINGESLMETEEDKPMVHTLTNSGKYQISVLDESGQVSSVGFVLE
ncbi:peptidoglycan glycosyltransferase PbpC [Budviciaceae bacterium BWR-B9]|uniref:Peptidoglycan glycosyltransferase PbpC n=1 Tax=Limnobaculum allomyrinae TaxID=2791986 RepID=A0ABS1IT52_9GAMM|nr:peptidoglycan glycosyltransferase PbpC [Limnobaculum allomyrinae]MBK5144923.1 peptidoglycan glycosyltransferase PbpC [Limnobaculum allomyrinae]MBV7692754.1 peptidoglycan glycosyltransferase PbpC [Limnobaculum sp. M2-1]